MKTALTWHHTATPSGPPQEVIESIRRYHTEEQGWVDVAYHLFIDAEGGLWPGRSLALDPDTHSDLDVHGHIFVAVLGNFEEEPPTKAAVETLRRVIEVLAGLFGIPQSRIQPHANIAETACPGRYLRTAIPGASTQPPSPQAEVQDRPTSCPQCGAPDGYPPAGPCSDPYHGTGKQPPAEPQGDVVDSGGAS
jgi:hypothetical protein